MTQRFQLSLWFEENQLTLTEGQLLLALTHCSFSADNNERLEFLGDAILDLIISDALYQLLPNCKEGQLSRTRALLVEGKKLAEIARAIGLAELIRLGKGEDQSGGRNRDSILAGCFEAVVGAIYLERGLEPCRAFVLELYGDDLKQSESLIQQKDPKTALQELLQQMGYALPTYTVLKTEGPEHQQIFYISCQIPQTSLLVEAASTSKKKTESIAAQMMLELMQKEKIYE